MTPLLEIKNLHAQIAQKEIIKNFRLTVNAGEVHAIMGPNGAGKSTLSYVLAGKPDYEVTAGEAWLNGQNLLQMKPEERANAGLFLSMQYPVAVPGVSVSNFLKHAVNAKRKYAGLPELDAAEFLKLLRSAATELGISAEMLKREINVGFSGGEKKRMEILQMSLLKPQLAILDEADSGVDIDALKVMNDGVKRLNRNQNIALLIITHNPDLFTFHPEVEGNENKIEPDFVHIYRDGHIYDSFDKTGGETALTLLKLGGYNAFGDKNAATD